MAKFDTTKGAFRDALDGSNPTLNAEILFWLSGSPAPDGEEPADDDDPIIITHPK